MEDHHDQSSRTNRTAAPGADEDDDNNDDNEQQQGSPSSHHPFGFFLSQEDFDKASQKPALEKQFDILHFLQRQAHRGGSSAGGDDGGSGGGGTGTGGLLAPNIIYRSTGIDLEVDTAVADMLQKNPKVVCTIRCEIQVVCAMESAMFSFRFRMNE